MATTAAPPIPLVNHQQQAAAAAAAVVARHLMRQKGGRKEESAAAAAAAAAVLQIMAQEEDCLCAPPHSGQTGNAVGRYANGSAIFAHAHFPLAVLSSRKGAPPVSGLDMIYEEEGDSLYSGLDMPSYAGSDLDSSASFGVAHSGHSHRSDPAGCGVRGGHRTRHRRGTHLPLSLRRSRSLPGDEFRLLTQKLRELERTDSEVSGHTAR